MEHQKEKRIHSILSNVFYYLFVALILSIFILSLVIEENQILNNILFVSLIISSLIIVFYLTVQMLRYNLTVNKKIQVGIFCVVIGFLLILLSVSKNIPFLKNLNLSYIDYNSFVYWGIGSIVLGIVIELTFIDQFLWNMFIQPFKFIWRITVRFVKWIRKYWLNIILYSLDLVSLVGIISISILWEISWWKITILTVSCVYPIIHHHKRIWKAIKYIAVDVIFAFFNKIYQLFKNILTGIWNAIVAFAKFLKKHWWSILKEILRLIAVAGGIVMIYFGYKIPDYFYLISIGIATIIISIFFTRKVVLRFIWNIITSIANSLWEKIVAFFKFLRKYWWTILKELIRLVVAAGGVYLIYYGVFNSQFSYFIALGIILIIISLIFSRKTVLVWTWEFISSIASFIWEKILKPYYKRIISEFVRLLFVGGGIFLIYYGIIKEEFYYFVYIGILVIISAEIIIRKKVLLWLYRFLKGLVLAFKDFLVWLFKPLKYLWKVFVRLVKFLLRNWFKVILYILDLVALAAIVYLSVTWIVEWWYIVLISISSCYIPAHHYKTVWKTIKYIGINIFYNPFLKFIRLIEDFFTAVWNWIVETARFLKKHWRTITKEFLRLIGTVGGIVLIVYGLELEEYSFLIWIGVVLIPISEIFSRKVVLIAIYNAIKSFFIFIYEQRVIISRILGFIAVIVGVILYYLYDYFLAFILLVSIGGTFTLFAHFIYHPKKFWEFLISIPETIYKVLVTIWLTIKTGATYVYQNGIRLILLVVMIFTLVYGALVAINLEVLVEVPLFSIFSDMAPPIRISIGAFFVVVAVVAFILLRRELSKLRTGSSKQLAKLIKERWKK